MSEAIKSKGSSRPSSRKVPVRTRASTKAKKNKKGENREKAIEIQGDESREKEIEIQGDKNREKEIEIQEDESREKEIEIQEDENQGDESVDESPDTSKKHGHDLDIIDNTRKTKKASNDNTNYYAVPMEFLEKLNSQNKIIWKNQIKQEKKIDEIKQTLKKMRREDVLTTAFLEKGIIMITKEIQKTSLYPTQELFKECLEEYIEKRSNGYINDIGKHNWDSRFHSEFMPMCLEKMRHRRGSLSKEIKSALFKVLKIPEIKSNAGSKIGEWKKSPCVVKAYSNIWDADDNNGLVNINKIIMKAMPKESKNSCPAPSLIAFALAICCIVLNPHTDEIKCSEESVKKRYVVFLTLLNDNKIPEESDIMHIQKEESKVEDNNSIENDSAEETDDGKFFD